LLAANRTIASRLLVSFQNLLDVREVRLTNFELPQKPGGGRIVWTINMKSDGATAQDAQEQHERSA
jgi:hypothetical protein